MEDDNIKNGAFQIARKLFSSELWLYKPCSWKVIWVYILGKVNYKKQTGFERGEGYFNFKNELKQIGDEITIDSVKKFLQYGRRNQMLSTKRSTRGVRLKVLKYNTYQTMSNYQSTPQSTREAPEKHQRSTPINKNVKNEKKTKEITAKADLSKNMKYKENTIDYETGEVVNQPIKENKNKETIRLALLFDKMASQYSKKPIITPKSYFIVINAINKHNLKPKGVEKLFNDWFNNEKVKMEDRVKLSFALSASNINAFKVLN